MGEIGGIIDIVFILSAFFYSFYGDRVSNNKQKKGLLHYSEETYQRLYNIKNQQDVKEFDYIIQKKKEK